MNQKGLFFDLFALKPKEVDAPEAKPRFKGNLIKEVMATCATVKEALAQMDRYSLYFMTRFQMLMADATGDAAIIEGNAVIRKSGTYQVVTNFRQSETESSDVSCSRYRIAHEMLANCRQDKLRCVSSILAATHQEGNFPTLYSNIYDLKAKSRYGQVPVLTVSVVPTEANMALSRVGGEYYAPRLRQFGKQVRIISNHAAKLSDGSEAFETKITWKYQGKTKLNSLVLSVFSEDKLIHVALHHTGEIDYLKHIPYSLSFK